MPDKRERERERATLWLSNSLPLGESLDFHSTKHVEVELDSTKTPKQESKAKAIDTDGGIYGDTIEDRLSRRGKATKSQDKTQGNPQNETSKASQNYKVLKAGIIGGGCNSNVGRVHTIALAMDRGFIIASACFSRDKDINLRSNIGINATLYDNYKQLARNACRDALDLVIIR